MSDTPQFMDRQSANANRRIRARQRVGPLVYIHLGSANGGMLQNLSEGGLALTAATELSQGALAVRFKLPGFDERVEARGQIAWLSESKKKAGIKFEDLPAEALETIRKWIWSEQGEKKETEGDAAQNHNSLEPTNIPESAELPRSPNVLSASAGASVTKGPAPEEQPRDACVPQPSSDPLPEFAMGRNDAAPPRDAESMSKIPNLEEASSRAVNRRAHPRRRFTSLAYVDLGANNGGILLNLGEDGLALTAAAKLSGNQLCMRLELPNVPERIETSARIVWLSESKKEAGVQFDALSSDALEKIRDCVSTEQCREKESGKVAAQEDKTLEPTGLPKEGGSSQEPIVLATSGRIRDELQEQPWVSNRWRSIAGRIIPEQSRVAIIALVAIISFATGIAMDRRFHHALLEQVEKKVTSDTATGNTRAPANIPPSEKPPLTDPEAQHRIVAERPAPTPQSAGIPSSTAQHAEGRAIAAALTNRNSVRPQNDGADARTKIASNDRGSLRHEPTPATTVVTRTTTASNKLSVAPLPLAQPMDIAKPVTPQAAPVQSDSTNGGPLQGKTATVPEQTGTVAPNTDGNSSNLTSVSTYEELTSGSVAISVPPFPSIRVPPGLKPKPSSPGTSLQMGQLVSRVAPTYPPEAARQRVEGTVKVHATISRDGTVLNVVASGPPILAEAAMNAVRQWRYRPTLLGGQAIEADEDIVFVFRLSARTSPSN